MSLTQSRSVVSKYGLVSSCRGRREFSSILKMPIAAPMLVVDKHRRFCFLLAELFPILLLSGA